MTNEELITKIKAEIDKRYAEYREKMKSDDFTYYEGMADALDLFERFLDSLESEKPMNPDELEKAVVDYFEGYWPGMETAEQCNTDLRFTPPAIMRLARHLYELGRKNKPNTEICPHSIRSKSFSMRKEQPVDICINTPTYSSISTEPGKDGSSEKPNIHLEVLDEAAKIGGEKEYPIIPELTDDGKDLHAHKQVAFRKGFKAGAEWRDRMLNWARDLVQAGIDKPEEAVNILKRLKEMI